MMARMRKRPPATSKPDVLAELVRTRLTALGDFSHLRVVRRGDHIVIERPGPPDDPDDAEPVLRLSGIGQFRFGLSLRRHTNRWEPLPISGVLDDVLAEAVRVVGPWLARDPFFRRTSGTAY
jgi:hypothetical protein